MKRKKIPLETESDVMFLSDLRCCIDNKRGDHIHHIDGNNSNNTLDNLALLCFDCHHNASIVGGLSKKLSAKTILKYREHHYQVIQNERNKALLGIDTAIDKLSFEDLIKATTTSIILLELAKIKREYYESGWLDRTDILEKLLAYKDHDYARIAYIIFEFLIRVAYETKSGLPMKMISIVHSLILSFFPTTEILSNLKFFELGKQVAYIGFVLIYNSNIHTKNFETTMQGYSILKYVYIQAMKKKNKKLVAEVMKTFNEIERQLQRPERTDLILAKKILNIHKNDLSKPGLTAPIYPSEIVELMKFD